MRQKKSFLLIQQIYIFQNILLIFMKCIDDGKAGQSASQMQLDFIINTCGKNVQINSRQTKSMISTLASIVLELMHSKHNLDTPQILQGASLAKEAVKLKDKQQEISQKMSEKSVNDLENKIKRLQQRLNQIKQKIKELTTNQKQLNEQIKNKQKVDQKVEILENKFSHALDRIQELQEGNKSPSKKEQTILKSQIKKEIVDSKPQNIKQMSFQDWAELQDIDNQVIVEKNKITNGVNYSVEIEGHEEIQVKYSFTIKVIKIVECIQLGVFQYNNSTHDLINNVFMNSKGECEDEATQKKVKKFKKGEFVSVSVDRIACTITFNIQNQQVWSTINIDLKDKDFIFKPYIVLQGKGDSVLLYV